MLKHVVLLWVVCWTSVPLAQTINIELSPSREILVNVPSLPNQGFRFQRRTSGSEWEDASDHFVPSVVYSLGMPEDGAFFFRIRSWPIPETPIRLIMTGDSTVSDFDINTERYYGWGHGMPQHFGDNIDIRNFANPGFSTATLPVTHLWQNILIIKPDFVTFQFGIIDELAREPEKLTTLEQYQMNLQNMAEIIRGWGGSPIIISPVTRRIFGNNGKIVPFLKDRSAAAKEAAREIQAHFIDLNQISEDFYNELGETDSTYISISDSDRQHFSFEGAGVVSKLVADRLPGFLQPYR